MNTYIETLGGVLTGLTILVTFQKFIIPFVERHTKMKNKKTKKEKDLIQLIEDVEELDKRVCAGEKHDKAYLLDSQSLKLIKTDVEIHTRVLNSMQQGVLSIIRDRLLFLIRKNLAQDFIYVEDFEVLQEMYEAYEENGGNHVITQLMQDVYKLEKRVRK